MITCCICNKKIGRKEEGHIFSHKYNNLIVCEKCHNAKEKLKVNVDGNIEDIQQNRKYFEELLYIGIVHTNAKEPLQMLLKEAENAEKVSLQYRFRNKDLLITTGTNFEGYKIVNYLNVLNTEMVLNIGMFSELGGEICDISGKTNNIVAQKISDAKEEVLELLKNKASENGANGLLGVEFAVINLIENMLVISATGTAVRLQKCEEK
ncbi:MAG: heavy metal-binding domain-containing protein [Lachnospiraceae bacterium]|nr:heavy metal-binding domain-containing protein [Lachnospiraceae bacterium]